MLDKRQQLNDLKKKSQEGGGMKRIEAQHAKGSLQQESAYTFFWTKGVFKRWALLFSIAVIYLD